MTTYQRSGVAAVIALVTGLLPLQAQSIAPISADRPDQTESVLLVPPGYLQVEAGLITETESPAASHLTIPGFLIRYGFRENLEFRLTSTYLSSTLNGNRTSGLTPVSIGMKVPLLDEAGLLPGTSFLGHLSIPGAASSGFTSAYAAPSFMFAMENTVSGMLSIGYNIGAQWDGMTAEPNFLYTFASGISLSETVGCFVEVYGSAPQRSTAHHRFDAGATWKITHDLMIDISGGVGLTSLAPDHFLSAGFSYRTPL